MAYAQIRLVESVVLTDAVVGFDSVLERQVFCEHEGTYL